MCISPLTRVGGTLLSHRTPDIFLQLFHPHCVLLFISVLISPSHIYDMEAQIHALARTANGMYEKLIPRGSVLNVSIRFRTCPRGATQMAKNRALAYGMAISTEHN